MSTQTPYPVPVGPDTLITVKVIIDGTNRRFKLALRDLGAQVLPQKLRFLLAIPSDADVVFERFSDSAGSYVTLDSQNPAIYKQLYRAAKAKLKLRIKATVAPRQTPSVPIIPNIMDEQQPGQEPLQLPTPSTASPARHSYLETVLSNPREPDAQPLPAETFIVTPVSELLPECSAAPMPREHATADNLSMPAPLEPVDTGDLDTVPQVTSAKSGHSRHCQDFSCSAFCIDCNNCGKSIPNEHYHCGICDQGDFDLCSSCIAADVGCDGEGHWLIKRRIQNGLLVNSVTERIAPKKWQAGSPKEAKCNMSATRYAPRTCNSCINEFSGEELVTCTDCADYDLCVTCISLGDHGHHPGHRFQPVSSHISTINCRILSLCEVGRGVSHSAICDGCDKRIFGVRHKCLSCPDWDYCTTCVVSAAQIHPGHRFAALFEQIADLPTTHAEVHVGIYCDGPLCVNKSHQHYIRGTRYKCAVCHDTDFCANCEALPSSHHNRTHPVIKFRTPVRHVSVTTLGEKINGQSMGQMGDRPSARNAATETTTAVANSENAASEVQTLGEVKPVEVASPESLDSDSATKKVAAELQAWFEKDSIPDGSKLTADRIFTQSWTIRNPGPHAWPAGCAVYFTGGDHMLNVDNKNPSSVTAMAAATKSNVMEHGVEVGQTAVFTVSLKTPEREGRSISYWRLKTPDSVPFGHKLWVDVTVTAAPVEAGGEAKAEVVEVAQEAAEAPQESKMEGSQTMIFPKLDKESPVSSVHGLVEVGAGAGAGAGDAAEPKALAEYLECLDLDDEDDEDDEDSELEFLTDDEYDMLDGEDTS